MASDIEIGRHPTMSPRAVVEWRAKGVLRAKGSTIDDNRDRFLAHLREAAAGRVKAAETNALDVQRTRVAAETAEELSRKNALARRELVPIEPISSAVIGMIEVTKAKLARVGGKVSQGDARLAARINSAINDALTDLSATGADEVLKRLAR